MERLTEIKTHVTGFSYTDKKEGIFAQNVYAKLAAYEDTGLTPEQIQAQQQEIERLNKVLDDWKYNAKCDADHIAGLIAHIAGLIAEKDEQAGRIMQYDAVLKQARKALKTCEETASSEKNQLFWTADVAQKSIKAIDALLGGKEDG